MLQLTIQPKILLSVFKNATGQSYTLDVIELSGGQLTGIKENADVTLYSRLGVPIKENININGEQLPVVKIQEEVYYSKQQGVIVGTPGEFNDQSVSSSFKTGVSKQNNGTSSTPSTILVLSVMIDSSHVLVAIVVKVNNSYQVASSNIVSQSSGSQDESDDAFSITLKTQGEGPLGGSGNGTTTTGTGNGAEWCGMVLVMV